ncbi:hypothetical protein RHGRI_034784 [Rhododendron griersonianum]|uniref:PWI domain-containing protein n=1 Tax=Rhododendron griersonianum TaxID=479676 RepID=A0AAV6I5E1_9ERIC|nr:hypothetical protein RHGRI_034784 [Rhododendron griersonianum]
MQCKMGSDLKAWVSDKLISLLGYSQPTVVQYVIGLSKTTSSPSDFVGKLVDIGLSASNETRAFAEEIYGKVPRKASGINAYQKQEREAALLVRKQKTYSLLEADDDDDHDVGGGSGNGSHISAASEVRKADDSHKKRFRKKTENQEDEDDEA